MKRLKRLALVVFALMATLTMNAESLSEEIVGKWVQTMNKDGMMVIAVYDFDKDGIMTQETSIMGMSPKIDIMAKATCSYSCPDDNTVLIKVSAKDVEFSKFEVEGLDPAYGQMAMEYQKNQMAAQEMSLKDVKIKDGKTLTCKIGKEEFTLTRK